MQGDLMAMGMHYDPAHTHCPTDGKATTRLLFTRTDLRFISGGPGCAMHRPTAWSWRAMKAVVRYVVATVYTGITYKARKHREPTLVLLKGF